MSSSPIASSSQDSYAFPQQESQRSTMESASSQKAEKKKLSATAIKTVGLVLFILPILSSALTAFFLGASFKAIFSATILTAASEIAMSVGAVLSGVRAGYI